MFVLRLLLVALLLALAVAAYGFYCTVTPPSDLYVTNGEIAGCPDRPSCVSSVSTEDVHRVAALGYTGDLSSNYVRLREVVERLGGKIQDEQPGYLHAVFTSPELKLRDDLEVLMATDGRVDVRSVSRFAYNDRGANRARVEQLRQAFEAMP